nr:MAG TPA: hypothetical protein [Caudoviricetes sp.]
MLNFCGLSISLLYQFDHQFRVTDVIFPVLNFLGPGFCFFGFYLCLFCPPGVKDRGRKAN